MSIRRRRVRVRWGGRWGVVAAGLVAFAALSVTRPAAADATKEEIARADALFREAQVLVQKGQYADGCAKFTESQRLDPANGTLLNLAFCHDKEGKFATAFRELQDLLGNISGSKNPDDKERTRVANDRLKVLDRKISRVQFDLTDVPKDATITLDSEKLADPSIPLLIDPGSHTVEASAAQKKPSKKSFEVKDPGPITVKLDPLPSDAPVPPPPPVAEPDPKPKPAAAQSSFWSGRRIVGAAVAVVGLAGVGVGVGFGFATLQNKAFRDTHCVGTVCDNIGIFYQQQATQAATISTIGFIAGTAIFGLGTVLFITAPRKAAPPPTPEAQGAASLTLGFGPRGMAVGGRF